MRIDAVESTGADQAVEAGGGLATRIGSGKQVVAPTQNERADRALGRVVIDFYTTILNVSGQGYPARQGVLDGLGQRGLGRQ